MRRHRPRQSSARSARGSSHRTPDPCETIRPVRPAAARRTRNRESRARGGPPPSPYHTTFAREFVGARFPGDFVRTTTSYRDVFLLSCCQALLLVNAAGLSSVDGLVGYSLTDQKALATLGVTTYVLGSAISTLPFSFWMAKVGRRTGFMTGATINILGCLVGAWALWIHSFALYCLATAIIGIYNAIGLQYRFAAAEVATAADKAKAISHVLAGGIVGGVIGPESTRLSRDWFSTPFLGSFALLALYALVALAVQSRVRVPKPVHEQHAEQGRPL